jgi:tripartite-type tricarboxylate transporter receptor subunit TctC
LPSVAPHLAAEKLRALAVTSPQRTPAFPQIPTLAESGIPGQSAELQIAMVAPAATPADVVALLQKHIKEIVTLPDVRKTLETVSFTPVGSTPAEYAKQIKDDIATWRDVVNQLSAKPN